MLSASAQTNWQVKNTFQVGGDGGWDYITVDAANHRVFVTRATHTQVIDEQTGKVLGDIAGQVRSHGVALVPELGRGFITDGGGKGAIVVFDLKTYAVLGTIPAMPDADGIIYDARQKKVLVSAGDSNALLTLSPGIDPANGKLDPPIALGGKPEFLAADGKGKVYVNLVDKDVVAVVDLASRTVIHRWTVAPAGRPVGLSLDNSGHRLFIGCRTPQKLVVMNSNTGAIEASLDIGAGVDAARFLAGQAFASTSDGALSVAAIKGKAWSIVQTVKTPNGARTMDLDPATHTIYLPTAELVPGANGRPQPKPDTFMIVVVSRP
jgi:DNA-binding beta-propeller fold protein YncE